MSQGQSQNDNSMDSLWIAGFLLVGFIVFQIWFGEQLAWLYLQIRWVWLKAITLVWEKDSMVATLQMIETKHVREWSTEQLGAVSSELRWFLFPVWGFFVYRMGMRAIRTNPGNRYKRVLGRPELALEMSQDFPWTLPALKENLLDADINSGPWAMADRPIDFIRKYALVSGRTLARERAEKLFSAQLGKLWTGADSLNKNTKALYACFAAQICRDKDDAVLALAELARTISAGAPSYARSDALLAKHRNDPRILEICGNHAYQYTVLIAMFDEAKKAGIMPPNFFLWLRPTNRVLWLVLNCVRRRTPFAEVSGIYAHFLAEKTAGHRIERPYIMKAVDALEKSLRDVRFAPITEDQNQAAMKGLK